MSKLDPTKLKDWEIAELAEENMKPLYQLARDLGLAYGELLPMGEKLAKIDYAKVLERLRYAPTGRYIDVTAITPTPLGEGKTTTTIGLVQGLGKLGKRVCGTIRQPAAARPSTSKAPRRGAGCRNVSLWYPSRFA
jgi:formate--tetrahydrofolate ligase